MSKLEQMKSIILSIPSSVKNANEIKEVEFKPKPLSKFEKKSK